jgi:hypothetical protein
MIFKDFTLWTPPLQIKLLDIIPQIDLKLSSTRWIRYLEGRLQTSPTTKKEGCRQVFCLWLTPKALSRNWLCSIPGLAPLQSSRIKSSVAWLEIFRPGIRHCRIWRTLATFSRTSHPDGVRQEDLQICTSQTNIDDSTTLQLQHRLPSSFY